MNERGYESEIAELEFEALRAGKRHSGMIKEAAGCSALVVASLFLAIFSDTPPVLNTALAVVGFIGGATAILESDITRAEFNEAKRKVEDYQKRQLISRLRP